jgi:hypothetical protein
MTVVRADRAFASRRLNSTVSNDQRRSVYDRKLSGLVVGKPDF